MSILIEPIGSVIRPNSEGYLVNPNRLERIEPEWRSAIDATTDEFRAHFESLLHSVYVRGSVAAGHGVPGVSDLDFIVILDVSGEGIERERMNARQWFAGVRPILLRQYSFVEDIDLTIRRRDNVGPIISFMLQVTGVCVDGEDLIPTLLPYRIGPDIAQHAPNLSREIEETKSWLARDQLAGEVVKKCRWIMKRLIRSGFELVMERAQVYTRDLYPCYQYFSRYYPERKADMYHALELAVNPTTEKDKIIEVLNQLGGWLVTVSKEMSNE